MSGKNRAITGLLTCWLAIAPPAMALNLGELPSITIDTGGRNSIFNKPLGTGSGSVGENLRNLEDTVRQAIEGLNQEIGSIEIDVHNELNRIAEQVGRDLTALREEITPDTLQVDLNRRFDTISSLAHNRVASITGAQYQKIAIAEANAMKNLPGIGPGTPPNVRQALGSISREVDGLYRAVEENGQTLQAELKRELAQIKADLDRELTVAKAVIDEDLTDLRANSSRETDEFILNLKTEWNYFGATLCGESKDAKRLQRQFDQGEISEDEYHERRNGTEGPCGFFVGADSQDGLQIGDEQGRVGTPSTGKRGDDLLSDSASWMRKVELQAMIDEMTGLALTGFVLDIDQSEDRPFSYTGVGFIEFGQRQPSGKFTVLIPSGPRQRTPPAQRVPIDPIHRGLTPVKLAIDAITQLAEITAAKEDHRLMEMDEQRIQRGLGPGESRSMGVVMLNGRYQGMVDAEVPQLLDGRAQYYTIEIMGRIPMPGIPALDDEVSQEEYRNWEASLNEVPLEHREAVWSELMAEIRKRKAESGTQTSEQGSSD